MKDGDKSFLFWLAVAVGSLALFGGAGYVTYTHFKQRGIRNNNPGNLRPSSDTWKGQSGVDNGINGPYLIFESAEYGIRALYKNLMTYRNKYNLITITGIINRWAPPSDKNDTPAYIAAVAKEIKKSATATLSLSDYPALLKAIIKHENGIQPYPDATISAGIALA